MLSSFSNVLVSGICTVVPEREICIDDELELYDGNNKRIERLKAAVGIHTRRVVEDDQTASDLCEYAARTLLAGMSMDRGDIDALIFVVQAPDYFMPGTSFYLHKQLELSKDCAVFDVNQGCAGYTYGLWLASNLVQAGSCKKVLLLVGDTQSRSVNPGDRSVVPVFGDAGSATLVEHTEHTVPSYFAIGADGSGYDAIIIPAGGYRKPHSAETGMEQTDEDGNVRCENDLHMDGGRVFNFTLSEVPKSIRRLLDYAEISIDDIDHVVLHQANKYIIESIAAKIGASLDKTPVDTLYRYGNQSSASIPAVICDVLQDRVRSERQSLLLSGFGVGLSWCSGIVQLDRIYCSDILPYK